MRFRKVFRIFVALLIAASPTTVHAYTMSMSSPGGGSTWQANANLSVIGQITWEVHTADPEQPQFMEVRPDACAIYIHAGGMSGLVTNSGMAEIGDVVEPDPANDGTGTETYSLGIDLTPADPPLGGGGDGRATYFIEAVAFAMGGIVYKEAGIPLRAFVSIQVRSG